MTPIFKVTWSFGYVILENYVKNWSFFIRYHSVYCYQIWHICSLPWIAPKYIIRWTFNHVVLLDHATKLNRYTSANTIFMGKSLGRVEVYNLELLSITFHDPLRSKLNQLHLHLQKTHRHQTRKGVDLWLEDAPLNFLLFRRLLTYFHCRFWLLLIKSSVIKCILFYRMTFHLQYETFHVTVFYIIRLLGKKLKFTVILTIYLTYWPRKSNYTTKQSF